MTPPIGRFARKVGTNLRSLGLAAFHFDDGGEIWRRLATLGQAMSGCPGGDKAVAYYKALATGDEALRPLISDAAERMLAIYRPAILLPAAQDGVIVDIGAGCGLFAALAALLHPGKTVWAFEPDAKLLAIARQAATTLQIANIEWVNAAVIPADWPAANARLDIFEDTVFRSVRDKGKDKVTTVNVGDLPFGADTPIAILKLVAPGMFLQLASALLDRTHALLGEVWKVDYATRDHAVLSPLLDVVPIGFIRDAENGLLYKTTAASRTTRSKRAWAPASQKTPPATQKTPPAIHNARAEPQISVIIPTYNIGDLIEPCVESVIKSIDRPTEILVINDGSTQPETLKALKNVAKMAHVRVIDKPNGGCASARNLGLQIANGTFVTLIDGDDFVDEGFLPLLNEAIHAQASNIAEIGFADYSAVTGDITDIAEPYTPFAATQGLIGYHANQWDILRRQPAIWRRLYRTQWLRQNELVFPERIKAFDDMEFQFISLYLNGGVAYANARGYYYRKDRPGQDVKASDTRHFGTFQMLVHLEEFLRNRRVSRDVFMLFDLFTIDCLNWSYSLIHPRLRAPFLEAARTFLLGGKSFDRALNVQWEISKQIGSSDSLFARDFSADLPDRRALELFHKTAMNFADQVYDYHFALEVSGRHETETGAVSLR